ncbi:MAG: CDP-glucose 4,6-dehydratase [Hyphomicrobiaceae bacterium]|nr:CDP-glucose 4,6-dehydratase [Hyphomicrobiaceae bacterium]
MCARPAQAFWSGRRVLLTGHTGFKGAWAAMWLAELGADVTGFARAPDSAPALYDMAGLSGRMRSVIGDLRDRDRVARVVADAAPEIVLHLAAQPIVRRAIADPIDTLSSNVMGTAHLLDAVRQTGSANVVLVVTSDKVYANSDCGSAFREDAPLGGKDPYSASKAATELVARSYAQTYLEDAGARVATARGGNVVGGGDYAEDRIIPDIVRAALAGHQPVLRMPEATRPWQHVLDCIAGYLCYAEALARDGSTPRALNFGPLPGRDVTVATLAEATLAALGRAPDWRHDPPAVSKEMKLLAVDSTLARETLHWRDKLSGDPLVAWTADWYRAVHAGGDAYAATVRQIKAYENDERI